MSLPGKNYINLGMLGTQMALGASFLSGGGQMLSTLVRIQAYD